MSDAAVIVEGVSKWFKLGSTGATSLKQRLVTDRRREDEGFWALKDIDLTVEAGETFGLLGHNGSGKSTLLKCIARTLTPTSGSIMAAGRVAALLELGAGFHPDLTGRENVRLNGSILGMQPAEVDARMDDIFEFAEIPAFADVPVRHYSSGMFARLGFAVAVNLEPDVLLVDEVLAVGDEVFQRKCIGEVRRFQREGRTIVFVSHSADLIRATCDRAAVLDHGRLMMVGEPPAAIRTLRDLYLGRGEHLADDLRRPEVLVQRASARITGVRIDEIDGRTWRRPGEPLVIEVGVEIDDELRDDVVVAMEMHDAEGRRLMGVNSHLLGVTPPAATGRHTALFEFDRIPLLGGVYHLSFGLHDPDVSTSFDHRDQKDTLRIENNTPQEGLVDLSPTIRWFKGN